MPLSDLAFWALVLLPAYVAWVVISHVVMANPTDNPSGGIGWRLFQVYVRVVHRLEVVGMENLPQGRQPGPLIVISNHTAGVDPVLVQAVCGFKIRWMMAADMQIPHLNWLWEIANVITVHRGQRDVGAARESIRHLQRKGVLGIFPEGGLERPARQIRPFVPGVGLIIYKSRSPVLPVIIEGTPQVDPAWASLWRFSRSRVRFMPVMDYAGSGMNAEAITQDLERKYTQWTGWKMNEDL